MVRWCRRAERGLFGGKITRFGNNVSHSERKTRRTWKPNVQWTTMRSDALDKKIRMPMTTHVIRTVKKFGSLDEYLVRTKDELLRNPDAIQMKQQILALRREQQREERSDANAPSPSTVAPMDTAS
eukprot:Plantae.Rhodophyta-Rhodochaete_pulchella.ctg9983.p1 GENE.Plantae.Rhodophyta-Rhodochaete_pulchella.ctg9983~~Plantae.Rhodophyta-Rhodochaete_pulchella.ctg9983.p1  ORF type:complete len:126 (+),score=21.27 Plantae.Rhodophyta-Rhodochaete_pulchella.ctg9983:44-421(+)